MPTDSPAAGYRFESFELQPAERRLLAQGTQVTLGPRAFDLLVELVDHAGHLLTKDQLLERVWPGVVVEENNLQVQISSLRKVVANTAIETVPGRGYRFIARTSRTEPQQVEAPAARRHNLPRSLTRFVGHESDFDDYAQALADNRLVTLTGVGGCGKTRLAIELAFRLLPNFPDGVWFVDLAPMADAERVPSIVATAMGVIECAGTPILDVVLDYVAHRRMLVVLDNCEHLVAACGEVASKLLDHGGGLRVLATSREPLGVPGERIFRVRSLSCPPSDVVLATAPIRSFEAVDLFVDRARLVDSRFALDTSSAPAVAEVCRQLDGIPFAIELAAARTNVLSVHELEARLQDRFRVLVAGSKTALPRQKTLQATIQWSYDLLTSSEQRVLQQLSVFASGCTLEAATAVADERGDSYEMLDRLTQLVDKSLVVAQHGADGQTRYSLLETVRQFARDRLADTGDADAVCTRHLSFYLALAEKARPELSGADQSAWFTRLDLDRENLLAAHSWSGRSEGGAESGLRLVDATATYWVNRGTSELGYRVTTQALARAPADDRSPARCRGLIAAALLASCMGRHEIAEGYLKTGLSIARDLGDDRSIVEALNLLAWVFIWQGRLADARRYIEDLIPLARRTEPNELVVSLAQLADICRLEGDLATAESLFQEALALAREHGNLRQALFSLLCLASLSIRCGSNDRARTMLLEAFLILDQTGSRPLGANLLEIAAGLAASYGDWGRSAQLYGNAAAQWKRIGMRTEPADEAFIAPLIARAREALGADAFALAEAPGQAVPYEAALADARAWLESGN